MRTLVATLLFLAIPTFAAAQQQSDALGETPVVELQQSQTPAPTAATSSVDAETADTEVQMENRTTQADDVAAMQEPATRQWWYLVGAIVVGGIILAVLL